MSMPTRVQALIGLAHSHLDEAGQHSPNSPFAQQIRLAAARLPLVDREHYRPPPEQLSLGRHLSAALHALDEVPPLDGPADLQLCAWHIHELQRLAAHEAAS
ncbi:hypothetical protein [Flexivirga alba]|uniref:Uncharacterized protein n=1 Tax=Flexivirga alba TaxID=702742 RepID=A0ABW2AJ10_9MICO